jgi:tetratricopeptide (TPR) repeat protein
MRQFFVALGLTVASVASAQDHVHPAGSPAKLGRVSFTVSCAPSVQPRFERAVAMLHSFWFEAADAAFAEIAQADSACALAYWGRAMTLMGNPMARVSPSPDALRRGLEYARRAQALAQRATHREQMYAEAVLEYYQDHAARDHLTGMKAHEHALDALRRAHPEDMEATIFYARTAVANAPPTDKAFVAQLAAGELLQPLFDKHPDHPGLAHYLIHAYDAPPIAERGAKAAKAYAGIAPAAPHALHMPSHIFTRLGYWDESIETNQRSARAEPDSNGAVHPMDYMVYAFLQQGRERDAKRVVDRAVLNPDRFYGGVLGYNFAAMPARFALERGAWTDAAELKLASSNAFPHVKAIAHFARGVGAARADYVTQARREVDSLNALKAQLDHVNDGYWATIVESQRLAVAAWIALVDRDTAGALRFARSAADLEETVEKHPVTPGPILPARELEGDLLMKIGRPAEALVAYEKTLTREPRRLRALHGAIRAARGSGNTELAQKRYAELASLLAKADPAVARKNLATK